MPEHDYFFLRKNPSSGQGELAVLFSGEGQPHPRHKMGPAIHEYYLVHTVLSGKGVIEMRGKIFPCGAGDTFVIFPGELFSYEADGEEPWHYMWAAFVGHAAAPVMAMLAVSPNQPVISGMENERIRELYRKIQLSFQHSPYAELEDLEASGWLRILLRELGMANRDRLQDKPLFQEEIDRQIAKTIHFLSLHYMEPITVEQLARTFGYHRTHLSKMFKRTTGLSPLQYLMNIRMERAKMLLEGTAMTVAEIAAAVGFEDALYFSKKFRSWTGESPTAYRKTLQGSE